MRLQTRIIALTVLLVTAVVILTGTLFFSLLHRTLREQLGENALDVARAVARMPEVKEAMLLPDPAAVIQPKMEEMRAATGASFIVVGNREGIRYSHPLPERLGLPMVGGDNGPALEEGREYVSFATGSLGRSVRGKVPLLDDRERVIGIVSVGFLLPEADRILLHYAPTGLVVLLIGLAIGVPGAWLLARSIKRAIHGLEPEEIAALTERQSAILGAIREGIIAIDRSSRVVVANATAQAMLPGLASGISIREVLPHSRLPEVLQTGRPELDQRMLIGETTVIANRIPVLAGGRVVSVVASFRDQTQIDRLSRELSDARKYAEALRAQSHEFANTLQAISGMLQLGKGEEAVDFIQDLTDEHRQMVEGLPRTIADPAVAALLLGKMAQAEEVHCRFVVDPNSWLGGALPESSLLVRVVGNLVDNALEAVRIRPAGQRQVRVRLAVEAENVIVEVADNGPGVPPDLTERVFQEGFSTKGEGRGIGLALVRRLVERAGGRISIGRAPEGGALFQAVVPGPEGGALFEAAQPSPTGRRGGQQHDEGPDR